MTKTNELKYSKDLIGFGYSKAMTDLINAENAEEINGIHVVKETSIFKSTSIKLIG